MNRIATHIFLSNLAFESRLEKICRTTLKLKLVDKVEVLGLWECGLKKREEFGNIHFIRIATLSKLHRMQSKFPKILFSIFSFVQFQCFVLLRILKLRPTYTIIHNAALLPIGTLAATIIGSKAIYEPHELESEQPGMSRKISFLIRNIERIFINRCHSIVPVSKPIAEFYRRTFRIPDNRLFVVTNQPENLYFRQDYPRTDLFRKLFGIPFSAIIYLYQGILDESRGIQDYLDTFCTTNSGHHIVFMGFGEMEDIVRKYADEFSNIHFKAAVPVNEIMKYTASADVGLFVISEKSISMSYRLSLPNKFFEYAICGLHICVSNNLEMMSQLISKEELGSVIGSSKQDLKNWMLSVDKYKLINNGEKSKLFRRNAGWQGEEEKYNLIYRS